MRNSHVENIKYCKYISFKQFNHLLHSIEVDRILVPNYSFAAVVTLFCITWWSYSHVVSLVVTSKQQF